MIAAADSGKRYLGRATLASLGLHLFLALLLPVAAWTVTTGPSVYTVSFTRISHIALALPHPPQVVPKPVQRSTPLPVATPPEPATRRIPESRPLAHPPAAAVAVAAPPAERAVATPSAAPLSTATPEIRQVASVQAPPGGRLPFGALQPDPVLDPAVLDQLKSLGVRVRLTIVVGDDGRTQSVAFDPPLDAATQAHIQALLASASWDPAYCGAGLPCQGRVVISL